MPRPISLSTSVSRLVRTSSAAGEGAGAGDGYTDRGGPAEQACCGYLNFFASRATARQWASQHPEVTGRVLGHARAQTLAAQTFRSLLSDTT